MTHVYCSTDVLNAAYRIRRLPIGETVMTDDPAHTLVVRLELLRELCNTLQLPNVASPKTPKVLWREALELVGRLRAERDELLNFLVVERLAEAEKETT
jgi:hypothetical protein